VQKLQYFQNINAGPHGVLFCATVRKSAKIGKLIVLMAGFKKKTLNYAIN